MVTSSASLKPLADQVIAGSHIIMSATSLESSKHSKDAGNEHYKNKRYKEALNCYTEALNTCPSEAKDENIVFLKNRAACYLQLKQFNKALEDTTSVLKQAPSDVKTLYRHAQALEGLKRLPEALKCIKTLLSINQKNTEAQSFARRLAMNLKEQAEAMQSTENVVKEMYSVLEDKKTTDDKKIKAAKNLAVLSRENAGAQIICQSGGIAKIAQLLNTTRTEVMYHLLQTLVGLCSNEIQSEIVLEIVTIDVLTSIICRPEKEVYGSGVAILKQALLSFTDVQSQSVKSVLRAVISLLEQKTMSAEGRDCVLELIITTVSENGLGAVFLKEEVVSALLSLAATSADTNSELRFSDSVRMRISVALSKLQESFSQEKELRDLMKEKCTLFVHSRLSKEGCQSKVEGLTALSTLLQGALEVGNQVFAEETVLAEMVKMAELDDVNCQAIAAEALALAASDKERCHGIMKEGLPVLKALYSSHDEGVRVRALVGLCKLGSVGGNNINARTLTEGSTVRLEKACRKFLMHPKKGDNLKKWATEGLAFLSLDAEVKEALIGDEDALKSLFQIPQTQDQSLLYGIASIFVNLTNSYDKPERNKELEELGKFAGENMPKEHEFDSEEYQKKRVASLLKLGVVPALVTLSAVDSEAVHEQISRVLLALTVDPSHRGTVIQQGGAKALVPMATNNTDKGKFIAAQALAKIGITNDPSLAFPGQRSLEVVRPLVALLKSEQGLQQFEGLMALTNLAGMSNDIRKRIYKEGGFCEIESLMFEEHDLLRRAATEAMCNLVQLQEIHERFLSDDVERVKLITLFSGEDDPGLAKAASGALAQLTHDPKICTKVMAVKSAKEIFKELLVKGDPELQHRGIYILSNLIDASKEIARELVQDDFLELIMALVQTATTQEEIKSRAAEALKKAQEYGLIKPNPELKK